MKTILVAGGAGYIGSHMVALLAERGVDTIVVDNLATGHRQAVKGARKTYIGDLRDGAFLDRVFAENDIDGVINFAACSLVGESVTDPLKYYGNNVAGSQSMLSAMKNRGEAHRLFLYGCRLRRAGKAAHLRDGPHRSYQSLWRQQAGYRGHAEVV